jgi:hypothetical protein
VVTELRRPSSTSDATLATPLGGALPGTHSRVAIGCGDVGPGMLAARNNWFRRRGRRWRPQLAIHGGGRQHDSGRHLRVLRCLTFEFDDSPASRSGQRWASCRSSCPPLRGPWLSSRRCCGHGLPLTLLRQLVELLLAVVIIAGCQNRCLSLSPGNQCCRRRNDMNCRWWQTSWFTRRGMHAWCATPASSEASALETPRM